MLTYLFKNLVIWMDGNEIVNFENSLKIQTSNESMFSFCA